MRLFLVCVLFLSGCGKPCDPQYDLVRSHYERHVSDLELEAKIKGVTYDQGPARWWGYTIIDWWNSKRGK